MAHLTLVASDLLRALKVSGRITAFLEDIPDERVVMQMRQAGFPKINNLVPNAKPTVVRAFVCKWRKDFFDHCLARSSVAADLLHLWLRVHGYAASIRGNMSPKDLTGWRAWLAIAAHATSQCEGKLAHEHLDWLADLENRLRDEPADGYQAGLKEVEACLLTKARMRQANPVSVATGDLTAPTMSSAADDIDLDTLEADIQRWEIDVAAFGELLERTGRAIAETHCLPRAELAARQSALLARWDHLAEALQAQDIAIERQAEQAAPAPLVDGLAAARRRHEDAERGAAAREAILALLDRCLAIRLITPAPDAELETFLAKAREARANLEQFDTVEAEGLTLFRLVEEAVTPDTAPGRRAEIVGSLIGVHASLALFLVRVSAGVYEIGDTPTALEATAAPASSPEPVVEPLEAQEPVEAVEAPVTEAPAPVESAPEPAPEPAPESVSDGVTALAEAGLEQVVPAARPVTITKPVSPPPVAMTIEPPIAPRSPVQPASHVPHRAATLLPAFLRREELPLAFWAAKVAEVRDQALPNPSSDLLEACMIGLAIRDGYGGLVQRLNDLLASLYEWVLRAPYSAEEREGVHLMVLSACVPPVLFAPQECPYALVLLETVTREFREDEAVRLFLGDVIAFAREGEPLNLVALAGSSDSAVRASLRQKADDVLSRLAEQRHPNSPAKVLLKAMASPEGLMHDLLGPVLADDMSAEAATRSRLERFYHEAERLSEAKGMTFNTIKRHLRYHWEEAHGIAKQWLEQCRAGTGGDQAAMKTLMASFSRLEAPIIDALAVRAEEAGTALAYAGAVSFRHVIDDLGVCTRGEPRQAEPAWVDIFLAPLLRLPELDFGLLQEKDPAELLAVLPADDHLSQGLEREATGIHLGWPEAFQRQLEKGDFFAAGEIIDRHLGQDEGLSRRRDKALEESRERLKARVKQLKSDVERAAHDQILAEEDWGRIMGDLNAVSPGELVVFSGVTAELDRHQALVTTCRGQKSEDLEAQIRSLESSLEAGTAGEVTSGDLGRVRAALGRGDMAVANEYLAHLNLGQSLESRPDKRNAFGEFFPERSAELNRFVKQSGYFDQLVEAVRARREFNGLSFAAISVDQARETADALQAWSTLKRNKHLTGQQSLEHLAKVMTWLGFQTRPDAIQQVPHPAERRGSVARATVRATVGRVPLSLFGSQAKSKYTALCVWGRPSVEDLLDLIGPGSRNQATVVMFFGHLDEATRRELALQTHQQRVGALVLDEALLLHLVGERGSRARTFVECAAPFASLNPYTPFVARNVPEEMFYGRKDAAENLADLNGPCIVLGGRQLGKSALLMHLVRTYHKPAEGFLVHYEDIRNLGETVHADTIWDKLRAAMKELQVVISSDNVKEETLIARIEQWMNHDTDRRIMMLFDEADEFLRFDASDNFKRVQMLKELMENTQRRFKVVFAGLHNVQRSTTIPNHPLAHLGKPIKVGPLAFSDAARLVEEPLLALGYKLNEPQLWSILTHTNFHPGLIQLFCQELVETLTTSSFPTNSSPPYVVQDHHIEQTYKKKELRAQIVERFEYTLTLDPRYQVIAYVVAYNYHTHKGSFLAEFGYQEILAQARDYWEQGFRDVTPGSMRTLLGEMCDLGVLVETAEGRYRLRSPNILRLLGSENQIVQRLLEASTLQLKKPFNAHSFRRALKSDHVVLRSPLTAAQEADLIEPSNGVRLLFGTDALSADRLEAAIWRIVDEGRVGLKVVALDKDLSHSDQLIDWIQRQIKVQGTQGHAVLLVPVRQLGFRSQPALLASAIEEAVQVMKTKYARERTTRVVFRFDPADTLSWIKGGHMVRDRAEAEAPPIYLRRWDEAAVGRWLEDMEISNTESNVQDALSLTGGWPILLERFASQTGKGRTYAMTPGKVREYDPDVLLHQVVGPVFDGQDPEGRQAHLVYKTLIDYSEPISFDELVQLVQHDHVRARQAEDALEFLRRVHLIQDREGKIVGLPLLGTMPGALARA